MPTTIPFRLSGECQCVECQGRDRLRGIIVDLQDKLEEQAKRIEQLERSLRGEERND